MNITIFRLLVAIFISCLAGVLRLEGDAVLADSPNTGTPDFGPNVLIFDPSTPNIQGRMNAIVARQRRAEFSSERYAYLLKPGKYELDVQVAFYMHVMGLGRSPDDVQITGSVSSKADHDALINFWRGVENVSVIPTAAANSANTWAVSQGATMRRTHIKGDLDLCARGGASGGYLADSKVDGTVRAESQLQWMSRNDEFGVWDSGIWNMVFVGSVNPPAGEWPDKPYTVVEKTPRIREKPYLIIDDAGKYGVFVPALTTEPRQGTSWLGRNAAGTTRPIDQFYIARSDRDSADTINAALRQGKSLILTPGIYYVDSPILVTRPDTVVLGLGLATLIPTKGTAAMMVSDVDGVIISSILFDASSIGSPTLLQIGEPGTNTSHAANPICLYDVFGRVGGSQPGVVDTMVVINSNDVVGDCLWLWRADHGRRGTVGWGINRCDRGLVVNGDNVTIYGLFVEHCQKEQTLWNGNGGRVYLYQCEMPYDPPSQDAWQHDGMPGYAGYRVADSVTTHEAWGMGVYACFSGKPIVAASGIEAPGKPGVRIRHAFTISLDGNGPGAAINHVISDVGSAVTNTYRKATVKQYP